MNYGRGKYGQGTYQTGVVTTNTEDTSDDTTWTVVPTTDTIFDDATDTSTTWVTVND